jgi:hypothetical protein
MSGDPEELVAMGADTADPSLEGSDDDVDLGDGRGCPPPGINC